MTLQAPQGFAGGPLTDDSWGAISSRGAWVESANDYIVTQPNSGTRSVSIAAGNAVAHGVRVPNDAAIPQALTAPGSGGQWYLLALRRDWTGGQKTCSLQVLTGPSTGSTTAPTTIPTSLPANLQTASGTAQADQPLAWVWASSASTALTIFDTRLIEGRSRVLQAASPAALATLAMIATPKPGALMPCGDLITYRWNGSIWRAWDSDFASFVPTIDLGGGAFGTNPGINARARFVGGRVLAEYVVSLGSGASTGSYAQFSLPYQADVGLYPIPANPFVQFRNASDSYRPFLGSLYFSSANAVRLVTIGNGNAATPGIGSEIGGTVPFNEAWGSGDQLLASVLYDPS